MVGKVRAVVSVRYICSVCMIDDACKELVKDTKQVKFWLNSKSEEERQKAYKYATFYYEMINGGYIGEFMTQNEHREIEPQLVGTRIVSKWYFEHGLCHESFSDVEGFGSLRNNKGK